VYSGFRVGCAEEASQTRNENRRTQHAAGGGERVGGGGRPAGGAEWESGEAGDEGRG
jgi:hypothetical protein